MEKTAQKILKLADIKINGKRPWDIQVKNPNFYSRVLAEGSLGLGESYMDCWWECKEIDEMISRILKAELQKKIKPSASLIIDIIRSRLFNMQRKNNAFEIGEKHYDAGNDLYESMLDKRMTYTCGYWKDAKTLDQAQEAKLDLICKKLNLKPGMTVLDIGCGWGSFIKYAAEKYKVRCLGITVSKEQFKLAKERLKGLPVEIKLMDYRELNKKFDRIVSVGMFEHVGYKNYRKFMKIRSKCLKDDGLFLLHTIGGNISVTGTDPWINKYIFPNGMLPSPKQITSSAEGIFVLEDWHNFSADYDKTLMSWYSNFKKNWKKIKHNYSPRFFRMWSFYLLSCAGSFRSRKNQLWQIVFSKKGIPKGYDSIR